MSEIGNSTIRDGQDGVNLRISAQDLSGLGSDVQNLLKQLAASQQGQQQERQTTYCSQSEIPANIPSRNGREMIQHPASLAPTTVPPARNGHHHLITNSWQHEIALQEPTELALDDFATLNATKHFTVQSSSSPVGMSSSSSPAAKASLRRQTLPGSSRVSTASSSNSRNSRSLELAHAPPIANGINLINPREVLPDRFRQIFPYDLFNAVQSKCFEDVYQTNDNLVVSAPTGSGKTAILELSICKLAQLKGDEIYKIVYLCPLKALCTERANDWRQKFGLLAIEVAELTGDTSHAEMRRVRQATIIITTPEKWDSITRSWSDHRKLLDLVELFLIDEVHLLKEPRGSTLEAVVSRMKTRGANVRFVALSATVPNSDDVARWLGRDHTSSGLPARRATFGEEFRPVKLQKFVYGFDKKTNDYQFDTFLTDQLYPHIAKHSQKKPILVFCQTRKSCQSSAKKLAEEWNERQPQLRPWPEPGKRIPVISPELQEIVRYGVAFHHAGLDAQDRRAIEQAFLDGRLSVICCTSTLAMGLNLPCHMVVLKGTTSYQESSIAELSDLEIMQMLGRAGRPQFGNSGVAVILTRARNKQHYEDMGSGQQILESTLHQNLIEHLNSEINLGTFQDIQKAKEWLNGTFLAVRLDRNPIYYKLTETNSLTSPLDDRLEEICETDISKLQQAGLVTEEPTFRSTDYGRAMSRYVIRFSSMQRILQIPQGAKMEQVLTAVCEADEFKDFRWRTHERDVFRELNKNPFIVYPIKEAINTMAHRVSLLLQAALGCVDLSDVPEVVRRQMILDTGLLFEKMHRLVRAVVECKASDLDGVTCRTALELARSMAARAWEGKSMQLTQIPQLGPVFMRKLVASGITTVHDLAKAGTSNIERILSRNPPFGKKMMDELAHFPRLTIEARIVTNNPQTRHSRMQPIARIDVTLGFSNTLDKLRWRGKIPSVTFMAETTEGVLAHWWRGSINKFKKENDHKMSLHFEVDLSDFFEEIICYFACEDIVGTVVTRKLQHGLPASAFLPKPKATPQPFRTPDQSAASWMDDDIGDNDLLEVTKERQSDGEERLAVSDVDSQWSLMDRDGSFRADNKLSTQEENLRPSQESEKEDIPWQPVQLPNGKFKCNHHCADAGFKISSGKACAHRCCREGLDKPRKPKRLSLKRKADTEEVVVADSRSWPTSDPPTKRTKTALSQMPEAQTSSQKQDSSMGTLSCATANRQDHRLIDLDDFDLDGDGLIDLTQFEGAHVDAPHNSHRSQYKPKSFTSKKELAENEAGIFEGLSDDALQHNIGPPFGDTRIPNDSVVAGKKTSPLHPELLKARSNSTDNFSGDSVVEGLDTSDCDGKPSREQSFQVRTTGASKRRLEDIADNQFLEGDENGLTSRESSSTSPPTMTRYLRQMTAKGRRESESRINVERHRKALSYTFIDFDEHSLSPDECGMATRVQEVDNPPSYVFSTNLDTIIQQEGVKDVSAQYPEEDGLFSDKYALPTPHTTSSIHDALVQQESIIEVEGKDSQEQTYIFSDKYMLPPPKDAFGECSVIPPCPNVGNPHGTGEIDYFPKNYSRSEKPQQGDPEWEGFEPDFTDDFRDLVEFI
ncbi:hypothetical protein J7T55_014907 [Diaporthe amygdali]|uniref:uncharacterized protein n=1 Tax=Phomopsis amygdali TaxID=1214568 RepID=UPI0022FE90D3|nr:uncharacterized protein J7T55_014907 [Diaporthe amygdali]KAJ0110104.1 hypothetical protein J7T55_014907 [Diaporthe amygdali]